MAHEYYAIDLPGKIAYKEQFNVSIRRITPIEQTYIISLAEKEQKSSSVYLNFIKQLIQIDNPNVKFEDLYWFDVQYILYRIRFTTYAKYPIKLTFVCNSEDEEGNVCDNEIKQDLEMGNLHIVTPDDLPNLSDKVILDNLGEVYIRNKKMKDDLAIEDFAKRNKIDISSSQVRLLLLDLCLISEGTTLDDLYKKAEEGIITASDIITIEKWFSDNIWGVKEEIMVKCPKCGKERSRAYVLALEDFFSAF